MDIEEFIDALLEVDLKIRKGRFDPSLRENDYNKLIEEYRNHFHIGERQYVQLPLQRNLNGRFDLNSKRNREWKKKLFRIERRIECVFSKSYLASEIDLVIEWYSFDVSAGREENEYKPFSRYFIAYKSIGEFEIWIQLYKGDSNLEWENRDESDFLLIDQGEVISSRIMT